MKIHSLNKDIQRSTESMESPGWFNDFLFRVQENKTQPASNIYLA